MAKRVQLRALASKLRWCPAIEVAPSIELSSFEQLCSSGALFFVNLDRLSRGSGIHLAQWPNGLGEYLL